jgi:hypothetical protein
VVLKGFLFWWLVLAILACGDGYAHGGGAVLEPMRALPPSPPSLGCFGYTYEREREREREAFTTNYEILKNYIKSESEWSYEIRVRQPQPC